MLWQLDFERGVRRAHRSQLEVAVGVDLRRKEAPRWLRYRHAGLRVDGRADMVPVAVTFYEMPPYRCFGLSPLDYPHVGADPGAASPHRLLDDSLCLFYPLDPPELRWTAADGLLDLLDLVRDHLLFEEFWRYTGGVDGGEWLGTEAPHDPPWGWGA